LKEGPQIEMSAALFEGHDEAALVDLEKLESAKREFETEAETAAKLARTRDVPPKEESDSASKAKSKDKKEFRVNVSDFRSTDTAKYAGPDTQKAEVEITVDLKSDSLSMAKGNAQSNAQTASQTTWSDTPSNNAGSQLENILARELHNNLNGDIVREASLALHSNGEATVRLNLKPETLGNVRIKLEMSGGKLTGHIVVESEEALHAFEREIKALETAFRESGFDEASLDMALAGSAFQNAGSDGEDRPFSLAENVAKAASRYDASVSIDDSDFENLTDLYYNSDHIAIWA
jgi:flagellar hook-length control protein FliK